MFKLIHYPTQAGARRDGEPQREQLSGDSTTCGRAREHQSGGSEEVAQCHEVQISVCPFSILWWSDRRSSLLFETSGRAAQRRRWKCQAAGHRGDRPTFAIIGTSEGLYNFLYFLGTSGGLYNLSAFSISSCPLLKIWYWFKPSLSEDINDYFMCAYIKTKICWKVLFQAVIPQARRSERRRTAERGGSHLQQGARFSEIEKIQGRQKELHPEFKSLQGPVVPAPAVGQTFTVTAHVCQVDSRQVSQTF